MVFLLKIQLVLAVVLCCGARFVASELAEGEPPSILASGDMLELRSNHVTVGANMSVAGSLNVGSAQLDVVREIASVASAVDQTNRSLVASVADIASFISDQNASIASLTATLTATQSEVISLKDQLEETATNASVVVASLSDKLINVQGELTLLSEEMLQSSADADKELHSKLDALSKEMAARFATLDDTHGISTAGRCSSLKCGRNNHYLVNSSETRCKTHVCEHEECCGENPTCEDHTCARGYTANAMIDTSKFCPQGPACAETDCCTSNPTCTEGFTCEQGYNPTYDYETLCASGEGCVRDDCCAEVGSLVTFSWTVDWSSYATGNMCWDYGRSPQGIAFSMTDRLGKNVADFRIPQPGEEVEFTIHGRGGTADGKVKTVTGKVEKLVMLNSNDGFLKDRATAGAFQFIGTDIRAKMNLASVNFDAMHYGSATERAGRSNEVWHIEFDLQSK